MLKKPMILMVSFLVVLVFLSACAPVLPVTGGTAPAPAQANTATALPIQAPTIAPTATAIPAAATTAPTMSMPAAPAQPAAPANPVPNDGAVQVSIANFAFSPDPLTVPVGTKVRWTNKDSAQHTVTSDSGTFDSGPLNSGATFAVTFSEPGTYTYHCSFHPEMVAKIIVTGAGTSNNSSGAGSGMGGSSGGSSGGSGGSMGGSNGGSGGYNY